MSAFPRQGGSGQQQGHDCSGCGAPITDVGVLCRDDCIDGRDGLRDLLARLTSRVIGAQAPGSSPLRVVVTKAQAGAPAVRTAGYGRSTAWDTPRGEAANMPRMLREARGRQTRFAAEQGVRVAGGEEPSLAVDHKAGDHLIRLQRVVAGLVILTSRATASTPDVMTWGGVARWLDAHMDVVRCQDWAPTQLADLRRVMAAAERHVDRPPARLYLGPCDQQASGLDVDAIAGDLSTLCPGEYRALEDDADATCTHCRADVDVATRKAALLAEASNLWMTAAQIERLTATLGQRVADSTVDSQGARGQIRRARLDGADGPWSFPLSDVLARIEAARAKERRSA